MAEWTETLLHCNVECELVFQSTPDTNCRHRTRHLCRCHHSALRSLLATRCGPHVIRINPGTERDINSPYEFLVHLYESIRHRFFIGISADTGTHIEKFTHTVSFLLFSLLYGFYCLRLLLVHRELTTLPSLLRAMALAWLVYCFIGSPWLWPWYFITFFGLFALIEAIDTPWHSFHSLISVLRLPLAVRLLAFAVLCLYFFDAWIPAVAYVPLLYAFHLTFLRGLWLCLVPLLAIRFPLPTWRTHKQSTQETQGIPQLSVLRRFIGSVHLDSLRRR